MASVVVVLLLLAAGCSGGGTDSGPTDDVVDEVADSTSVESSTASAGNDADNSTEAPSGDESSDDAPAAPVGLPLIDDLPVIDVLGPPESGAGDVPLFEWSAVDGAADYRLAVVGPAGPQWAWVGDTTEIYFGGLSIERPPGLPGLELADDSCWSVVARDAHGGAIAVSQFLPVSPGEATGHECVPGANG